MTMLRHAAMAKINSFRDVLVWQKAIDLDQIRKSAVSIPSNIAEGKSRQSIRFTNSICGSRTAPAASLRPS
jgi:four helix bundle protein